ncbi:hypothetical protein Misp01_10870 [Microtetraspora sp. NBRC 13810]|uniref:hypothetical protein n=1 Tax=Microtetraspora sp. NBRC 13810 TaxID=3030990 RepID=UPI0024A316F0|nr:hypothetical protein [Microtetraspora sp. NBRC 13810]GLW05957.1 hypothetical protein Misp01_10870 [Microtetraspora sp. NBRC 13810]
MRTPRDTRGTGPVVRCPVDDDPVTQAGHGEPYNAEPGKCDALDWHPVTGLPGDIVVYPAAAVRAILDGEPFDVFGFDR